MDLRPSSTRRPQVIIASLGIAGALLIAAGLPVHASTTTESITGSFEGSEAFTSPTTIAVQGSGHLNLMGRASNVGVATSEGQDASGCILNVNNERLISANGDELDISSNDDGCPVSPGVYHGTGQWTVSGGTGRFAGRTGSGTLDGYSNFGSGTFTFTLSGTVTSD